MSDMIAVCGFIGSAVSIDTESRFRPYSFGTMKQPPTELAEKTVISTVNIAQRLAKTDLTVSIYGVTGDDNIGNNLANELTKCSVNTTYLCKIMNTPSEQLLIITDCNGYSFTYRFNPFAAEVLENSLSQMDKLQHGVATGVITSLNADVMLHAFNLFVKKNIPIIWNAYMCYNSVTPIQLLGNIRQSKIVILSSHEAGYLKRSLGFTGIDQMVSEGPSDILILEYTSDGRMEIDHYDKDRHTVSYNVGKGGMPPSILMDSMDEFSIGMAEGIYNDMPFTEIIKMCMERINSLPIINPSTGKR